jgi:hypothetical protein
MYLQLPHVYISFKFGSTILSRLHIKLKNMYHVNHYRGLMIFLAYSNTLCDKVCDECDEPCQHIIIVNTRVIFHILAKFL